MKPFYFFLLTFAVFVSTVAQEKRALVVGISEYPSYDVQDAGWSKIHGANDVKLVAPILKKQGFVVTTLANEHATIRTICGELEKLVKKTNPGDIVYIHFSGHGQAIEDEDGDETDGWDESFIPYDAQRIYRKGIYAGENHLTDDILNRYLTNIRHKAGSGGMVYVVIDGCHAGSSYRGEDEEDSTFTRGADIGFSATGKTYAPRIDKRGNITVPDGKGMAPVCMIEACRSYEVNTEIKQDGVYYGPLSYYISRELQTSKISRDTTWIENVRKSMDGDLRLIRQHLVIEKTR